MASVKIENVTKEFKDVVAVKDLTMEIKDGEFLVFLGPSGCGKTTILRIIAGLENPTEGQIYINGKDVTGLRPKDRNVAMVFQSYSLYPHMTAFQNMAFPLRIAGIEREKIKGKVEETAELLGVQNLLKKKPRELSGGQSQRIALGRAIVREPSIFLFDEPLSNLDAKLRVQMRGELTKLHKELGITSIYVTHDQVEAMTLGERIALLKEGILMQHGKPMEIYENPVNTFVASFLGSPSMNLLPADEFDFLSEFGKNKILGIRPEDIEIVKEGITTELDVAEVVGSEVILHLKINNKTIVVKTEQDEKFSLEPGEKIDIDFDRDNVYMFSKDKGERIDK